MEMEFWTNFRATMRDLLAGADRERFLQWPPIVPAVYYDPPPDELRYLQSLPDWPAIRELLKDPGVGGATLDPVLHTNGNIIHHVYSILQFETTTGRRLVGDGRILEIGGGYGNFCRLTIKRGFTGRYVIYDLPEMLQLQQWYLERTLSADEQKQVEFVRALPSSADIIVGLWSISEMPFEWRDSIKALQPKYFFVGYQRKFSRLDSVEYFNSWFRDPAYNWTHVSIPHIDDNFYLYGMRK